MRANRRLATALAITMLFSFASGTPTSGTCMARFLPASTGWITPSWARIRSRSPGDAPYTPPEQALQAA
jgi:hypothetical protein